MALFSEQEVFCNGCGRPFPTTFHVYGGTVCSHECYELVEWKKTTSMLGKEFELDRFLEYLAKKNEERKYG